MYQVKVRARFERAIKKLDKELQRMIIHEIEILAEDPFAHQNVRKIGGTDKPFYRLRIGRWRVLYILITKDRIIEVIDLFLKQSDNDYKKRL